MWERCSRRANRERRLVHSTEKSIMKPITKFIFGLPMLALASGSIAFAQVPPVTPPDSDAKAAALGRPPGDPVTETVRFPKSKSAWHLTVNAVRPFGLVITGASFQKSPTEEFIYVLFDGRLGEIFVPYHNSGSGSPRYPDIVYDYPVLTLNDTQYPKPREIIGGGKICKEVREYLAWMNAEFPRDEKALVRYGEEVVYFSVLKAANYAYIEEWTFRDDGTILVRAGSTGPRINGTQGHMHNFTWRLDIDLNGAGGDSAYLTKHEEDLASSAYSTATDGKDLISVEGGDVWNPQQFNTLEIRDRTLKEGRKSPSFPEGRPTSYELVPMRTGTARHTEPFTKKDFWVTRYDREQSFIADNLPDYVKNKQSTVNQDIVIWYTGSEHHETNSRDEDFNTVPVLWTGFELVPNNLFNRTPFYP